MRTNCFSFAKIRFTFLFLLWVRILH